MGWDKDAYALKLARDNASAAERSLERARAKLQTLEPPPPAAPPAVEELSDDEVAELLADDDQIDALVDDIMADDDEPPPAVPPPAPEPPADEPNVSRFSRRALRGENGQALQREIAAALRAGREIKWEP